MPGLTSPVFQYKPKFGGAYAGAQQNQKEKTHDFLLICLIILAICGFIIARQEYKIYQVNKELEATTQRVENLKKDKEELEAEKKRLDDLKYIEKLAREDHNMVGKDEVPLFIVDG